MREKQKKNATESILVPERKGKDSGRYLDFTVFLDTFIRIFYNLLSKGEYKPF